MKINYIRTFKDPEGNDTISTTKIRKLSTFKLDDIPGFKVDDYANGVIAKSTFIPITNIMQVSLDPSSEKTKTEDKTEEKEQVLTNPVRKGRPPKDKPIVL